MSVFTKKERSREVAQPEERPDRRPDAHPEERPEARLEERPDAERALRESEAVFQLAVKAAGFGVYTHDVRKNQSWWSPELHALLGVPPTTQVTLQVAQSITHPDDRERMMHAMYA